MALQYRFCSINLRPLCFLIAYMNLLVAVVDIICHVMVVAIVTRGFQCDVDEFSIRQVDWPWVEHLLIVINMGTHGFYPFPLAPRYQKINYPEYLMPEVATAPTRCYPGMVHVNLIDVFNFMINMMWLNFVKSYLVAVHKKDHEKMSIFFIATIIKILLQIIYFEYYPTLSIFGTNHTFWCIKLVDIFLAVCTLFLIHDYRRQLKEEARQAAERRTEQPPPYIECLISGAYPVKTVVVSSKDDKLPVVVDEVDNKNIEVVTVAQPVDEANQS